MLRAMTDKWQFWIDRGGTFTDIVGLDGNGQVHTHKLLSENPEHYEDAAIAGMAHLLEQKQALPCLRNRSTQSRWVPRWRPMRFWNAKGPVRY